MLTGNAQNSRRRRQAACDISSVSINLLSWRVERLVTFWLSFFHVIMVYLNLVISCSFLFRFLEFNPIYIIIQWKIYPWDGLRVFITIKSSIYLGICVAHTAEACFVLANKWEGQPNSVEALFKIWNTFLCSYDNSSFRTLCTVISEWFYGSCK